MKGNCCTDNHSHVIQQELATEHLLNSDFAFAKTIHKESMRDCLIIFQNATYTYIYVYTGTNGNMPLKYHLLSECEAPED